MKKIFILIILLLTINLLALDKIYDMDSIPWNSNKGISMKESIKLKIYQWIFVKTEGVNELIFDKPGKKNYVKLMDFVVGSNDIVKYNIKLNAENEIIKRVWLWEVLDNNTAKYLKSANGNYLEGFSLDVPIIEVEDGLKFKQFRIGADFDIGYNTKPQDTNVEIVLNLVPKVKF